MLWLLLTPRRLSGPGPIGPGIDTKAGHQVSCIKWCEKWTCQYPNCRPISLLAFVIVVMAIAPATASSYQSRAPTGLLNGKVVSKGPRMGQVAVDNLLIAQTDLSRLGLPTKAVTFDQTCTACALRKDREFQYFSNVRSAGAPERNCVMVRRIC